MKVKLGIIKLAEEAAQKLLAADLPVKTSWKLRKAFNLIKKELEDLEELRIKLVNKHGTPDKVGNINVMPDKLAEFLREFNPLLEQEVEINYFPVPISEVLEAGVNFSPMHLSYLEQIGLIFDDLNEKDKEEAEAEENKEEGEDVVIEKPDLDNKTNKKKR